MTIDPNVITIFTDGAARGNPGPGGYGTILMYRKHIKEISEGYRHTTNNRMELMAVIKGLQTLTKKDLPVEIYSDSQYVVNAVQKGWLAKWVRTSFAGGKKNADLWTAYHNLAKNFSIKMTWVKGHAENPYNNRCDELAVAAATGRDLREDMGFTSRP